MKLATNLQQLFLKQAANGNAPGAGAAVQAAGILDRGRDIIAQAMRARLPVAKPSFPDSLYKHFGMDHHQSGAVFGKLTNRGREGNYGDVLNRFGQNLNERAPFFTSTEGGGLVPRFMRDRIDDLKRDQIRAMSGPFTYFDRREQDLTGDPSAMAPKYPGYLAPGKPGRTLSDEEINEAAKNLLARLAEYEARPTKKIVVGKFPKRKQDSKPQPPQPYRNSPMR